MNDDIKTLGPIRVLVDRIQRARVGFRLIGDRPFDIGQFGNAFGNDRLLSLIVVAASAADEQRLDRLIIIGAA